MPRRIAPTVQRAILGSHPWDPSDGPYQQSLRELRALLAVARAAKRALSYSGIEDESDPVTGEPLNKYVVGLLRAVARLERVSRGGSGRER